jgi:pyruvate/2-oxoglutarate dehydrogenase complex dihydrolipoamide acyltransferase (E2) component
MLSLSLGSIAGVGPLLRNELTLAGTFSSTAISPNTAVTFLVRLKQLIEDPALFALHCA